MKQGRVRLNYSIAAMSEAAFRPSVLLAFASTLLVGVIFGALPFITAPTMGQLIWLGGFAESMSEGPFISLRADDIGLPLHHTPAFGFAGALPMAVLIEFGVSMPHAYTIVFAAYLGLAAYLAFRLTQALGATSFSGVLLTLAWMTTPVAWAHTGYSFLSVGFVLLPGYLFLGYRLLQYPSPKIWEYGVFLGACQVAVFIDGYTFVMFAVAYGLFAMSYIIKGAVTWEHVIKKVAPAIIVGFGGAYMSYAFLTKATGYDTNSLDFFRAWGADLTFFLQPSQGISMVFDMLGLAAKRPEQIYYGDASTQYGTFILPLIIGAGYFIYFFRKAASVLAFSIIALWGVYFSLGPSFKMAATKAPTQSALMPAAEASAPTGTGRISKYVPGFKNMRSSYRWIALGHLGLWGVIVIGVARSSAANKWILLIPAAITIINLPSPVQKFNEKKNALQGVQAFTAGFAPLSSLAGKKKVLFVPYANDMSVNYLAPLHRFDAYNIGGDKNYFAARRQWPSVVSQLGVGALSPEMSSTLLSLFAANIVDGIVLSRVDLLKAAHGWPPEIRNSDNLEMLETRLAETGFVNIDRYEYFSIATLSLKGEKAVAAGIIETPPVECLVGFCATFWANGLKNYTLVGDIDGDVLITKSQGGFFFYGPYIPLNPGRYNVSFDLDVTNIKNVRVDIVSGVGDRRQKHYEAFFIDAAGLRRAARGIEFSLEKPADNIEIRMIVSDKADILLRSYSIKSVQEGGK